MITIKKIIEDFHFKLGSIYEKEEIRQFINRLFEYRLGWNSARVHSDPGFLLSRDKAESFYADIAALQKYKPVQYITGETEFSGALFFVTSDVLIPRPETEELVQLIIRDIRNSVSPVLSILDIGTGSGCIAVSLKRAFPDILVTGTDISGPALDVARQNAHRNNAGVSFIRADVLSMEDMNVQEQYDIIVSNPPYVTTLDKAKMQKNVLWHEPPEALFVTECDPLQFYKAIAEFGRCSIQNFPAVYLEINERFGRETREVFISGGWENVGILKDSFGKDRFIKAIRAWGK